MNLCGIQIWEIEIDLVHLNTCNIIYQFNNYRLFIERTQRYAFIGI